LRAFDEGGRRDSQRGKKKGKRETYIALGKHLNDERSGSPCKGETEKTGSNVAQKGGRRKSRGRESAYFLFKKPYSRPRASPQSVLLQKRPT